MSKFITTYSIESEGYKNLLHFKEMLSKFCDEQNMHFTFKIKDVYFDAGQNWTWTTIVATDLTDFSITRTWQILCPRDHEFIILGNFEEAFNNVKNQLKRYLNK